MAQDDKPESIDNKIDALAAMAGGQDISHDGFNAVEEIVDPDQSNESDAAAALAAQTGQTAQTASAPTAAPAFSTASVSGARKSRASTLKKQQAQVHAEQFKRMMIPILLITGILLLLLGGVVMFLTRGATEGYTGSGMLGNPALKRIMVITSFPLGAILMVGAFLFHKDIKRGEAAIRRANERYDESEG